MGGGTAARTAEAPSVSGDELPAVMVPCGFTKAGFNLDICRQSQARAARQAPFRSEPAVQRLAIDRTRATERRHRRPHYTFSRLVSALMLFSKTSPCAATISSL